MAAKNSEQILALKAKKNTVQVTVEEWRKVLEDKWRVRVIGFASAFDTLLQAFLEMAFPQRDKEVEKLFDFDNNGPLVNLPNKARLAYALGLIDKTMLRDLKLISSIRNRFAHNLDIGFADPDVQTKCRKLSTFKGHKITPAAAEKCYQAVCMKYTLFFARKFAEETKKEKSQQATKQE